MGVSNAPNHFPKTDRLTMCLEQAMLTRHLDAAQGDLLSLEVSPLEGNSNEDIWTQMHRSLQAGVNIISKVVNPLDGCYIHGSILSFSLYTPDSYNARSTKVAKRY